MEPAQILDDGVDFRNELIERELRYGRLYCLRHIENVPLPENRYSLRFLIIHNSWDKEQIVRQHAMRFVSSGNDVSYYCFEKFVSNTAFENMYGRKPMFAENSAIIAVMGTSLEIAPLVNMLRDIIPRFCRDTVA